MGHQWVPDHPVGAAHPGELGDHQGELRACRPSPFHRRLGRVDSIAAAVGPFIGGLLVDAGSWRWIFLSALPGLGLGGVTYALIKVGARGSMGPLVMGTGVVGLASVAGFVLVERRSRHLMLPLVGLGLSLTVAPLTATVLAAAEDRHVEVESGVNNAVARAAQLVAVAVIPGAVGLTGNALTEPTVFAAGFRAAMLITAALATAGGALGWLTIRNPAPRDHQQTGSACTPRAPCVTNQYSSAPGAARQRLGRRCSKIVSATCTSTRAKWAPRQWWIPWPKDR